MTGRRLNSGLSRPGIAMAGLALAILLLALFPGPSRAAARARSNQAGSAALETLGIEGQPDQVSSSSTTCESEGPSFLKGEGDAFRERCPHLPRRVAPARTSSNSDGESGPRRGSAGTGLSALVTNEAGDELDVYTARPGTLWFEEPSTWVTNCKLILPVAGSGYMPCAYVSFYDAGWETAEKAPATSVREVGIYDACGTLKTSIKAEGWHVVGTEYIAPGWAASENTKIPVIEPPECFGVWKMVYAFTETFSDKETLTDSVEVPFAVLPGPRISSARWGGGNPTEESCSEQCAGDPVNTATGEYSESATDLVIPGRGPQLAVTRTYSSFAARAGASSALGRGWAFSYGMALSLDPETGDATIINPNGSRTQFYSTSKGFMAPAGVLATLVKSEGGTYTYTIKARTKYTFDSAGKLIAISDLNGNEVTLSYDEAGRLQIASDEAGRTFTFGYNELGLLKGVSDSTGRSVGYAYDEAGRLSEVTGLRGGVEHFTYDENGQLLTMKDPRGNVVLTNTYDSSGRVLSQTDALEGKTTFNYVEEERTALTEVTNPREYKTKYFYENGILGEKIEAVGTGHRAAWTYEYDPLTLALTAVTDPDGRTRHMRYDASGNLTSSEDALGHKTESTYDALNDLTTFTNADGITTTYEYDERGNLLRASTPLVGSEPAEAQVVEYAHEDEAHPGDLTAITDPDGKTSHFTYDKAGDLTSVTDVEGDQTTYEYDERGDRVAVVSPRGNAEGATAAEFTTSFSYDAAGNRLTAVNPLGHERKWSYDADGNLETETVANGQATTYGYDAGNQRISIEKPNGQIEKSTYDPNGNLKSQTNGLEHATTYKYDPLDHLEATTDPLSRTTSYVYDGVGNLTSRKDPKGRTTAYSYDAANELAKVDYSETTTPDVEYGYDAAGRRIWMKDGTGESTYSYDSLGRLVGTKDGSGHTSSYGYDLAGNETSIIYPNGKTVARGFDGAGRLTKVEDWLGNSTTFAYDRDSDLQATTFPTGTGNIDEYTYDRSGLMSGVQMKKGTEALASLGYLRDPAGQVSSVTTAGLPGAKEEAFEYDLNERLTKAGSEAFGYDAANDLTAAPGTTNTYDAAAQLESSTSAGYSYDSLGERVRANPAAPAASYVFAFGSFGSATGKFSHPSGIAVDAKGNVWVVDRTNSRLEKFDSTGKFLTSYGSAGTGNGQFTRPTDVAIDSSGNLWVADTGNNRVQEISESGKYLTQFGTVGSATGQFKEPEGIDIDSSGNIWVADTYNGRVQEFSSKGKFIRAVGEKGSGEGKITEASDVAIGLSGHVWIADWGNRVEEFSSEGAFIRQVGSKGSANGQFLHADAIDVDTSGNVWVGDEENNRVQKFNESGEYLGKFGTSGSGEGQFSFAWPMGIAVSSGKVWVSDTKNNRVEQWKVTELQPATTYSYDQAGNLTAIERPKSGEKPAIAESYAYDGTGLRTSQTVSGVPNPMIWDQSAEMPLLLNDGQTNYIYGPEGQPVEQISSLGVPTFYHHDQLGSTRMLTSSSGSATATFSYGAYGAPTGATGSQATPLGYAGQYTNAQSGVQYLRARTYDPATGQFLTADPAVELTLAPYGYAAGNPINTGDPRGLGICLGGMFFCDESDDPCSSIASGPMLALCALPESAQQDLTDASAGVGDQASFGLTKLIRSAMGTNGVVNECSIWYHGGQVAAFLAQLRIMADPGTLAMLDYWSFRFAQRYPQVANFLSLHGATMNEMSGPVRFYLEWITKHIPR
jgi:RHS repeat-associated protein